MQQEGRETMLDVTIIMGEGLQVVVKVGVLRCRSNLSLTSVLDAGGSTPCPGRFTPGKRLFGTPNSRRKRKASKDELTNL